MPPSNSPRLATHRSDRLRRLLAAALIACAPVVIGAQGRGPSGLPATPLSGRAAAPFEITGYWVTLVTDDWRYRMITPPKGNVDYLPVNPEARRVADTWDPARDEAAGEQCRAYGAAGVMRLPGRLHITWEGENTLRLETDTGSQTRRFQFGADPPPPPAEPTWQGYSVARWTPAAGGSPAGELTATTTRMRPGYLRKNGVPYSADAVLTEYFVRLLDEGGQEYLAVTMMLDDPQYLLQTYVKTYQFKKERDGSRWNPTPCSVR